MLEPVSRRLRLGLAHRPIGLRYTLNILQERYEVPLMAVENDIGLHETPDENGMVQDDARIAYLRAHIEQMKKTSMKTASTSSTTAPGAPSASSPSAPARWRNAMASSTSTRTTRARERSRAPKHTASRQPLTCPESSGHHTITSLTTFRSCQADENTPQGSPLPAAGPECRFTRIWKMSSGRKIAERPFFMAVAENES